MQNKLAQTRKWHAGRRKFDNQRFQDTLPLSASSRRSPHLDALPCTPKDASLGGEELGRRKSSRRLDVGVVLTRMGLESDGSDVKAQDLADLLSEDEIRIAVEKVLSDDERSEATLAAAKAAAAFRSRRFRVPGRPQPGGVSGEAEHEFFRRERAERHRAQQRVLNAKNVMRVVGRLAGGGGAPLELAAGEQSFFKRPLLESENATADYVVPSERHIQLLKLSAQLADDFAVVITVSLTHRQPAPPPGPKPRESPAARGEPTPRGQRQQGGGGGGGDPQSPGSPRSGGGGAGQRTGGVRRNSAGGQVGGGGQATRRHSAVGCSAGNGLEAGEADDRVATDKRGVRRNSAGGQVGQATRRHSAVGCSAGNGLEAGEADERVATDKRGVRRDSAGEQLGSGGQATGRRSAENGLEAGEADDQAKTDKRGSASDWSAGRSLTAASSAGVPASEPPPIEAGVVALVRVRGSPEAVGQVLEVLVATFEGGDCGAARPAADHSSSGGDADSTSEQIDFRDNLTSILSAIDDKEEGGAKEARIQARINQRKEAEAKRPARAAPKLFSREDLTYFAQEVEKKLRLEHEQKVQRPAAPRSQTASPRHEREEVQQPRAAASSPSSSEASVSSAASFEQKFVKLMEQAGSTTSSGSRAADSADGLAEDFEGELLDGAGDEDEGDETEEEGQIRENAEHDPGDAEPEASLFSRRAPRERAPSPARPPEPVGDHPKEEPARPAPPPAARAPPPAPPATPPAAERAAGRGIDPLGEDPPPVSAPTPEELVAQRSGQLSTPPSRLPPPPAEAAGSPQPEPAAAAAAAAAGRKKSSKARALQPQLPALPKRRARAGRPPPPLPLCEPTQEGAQGLAPPAAAGAPPETGGGPPPRSPMGGERARPRLKEIEIRHFLAPGTSDFEATFSSHGGSSPLSSRRSRSREVQFARISEEDKESKKVLIRSMMEIFGEVETVEFDGSFQDADKILWLTALTNCGLAKHASVSDDDPDAPLSRPPDVIRVKYLTKDAANIAIRHLHATSLYPGFPLLHVRHPDFYTAVEPCSPFFPSIQANPRPTSAALEVDQHSEGGLRLPSVVGGAGTDAASPGSSPTRRPPSRAPRLARETLSFDHGTMWDGAVKLLTNCSQVPPPLSHPDTLTPRKAESYKRRILHSERLKSIVRSYANGKRPPGRRFLRKQPHTFSACQRSFMSTTLYGTYRQKCRQEAEHGLPQPPATPPLMDSLHQCSPAHIRLNKDFVLSTLNVDMESSRKLQCSHPYSKDVVTLAETCALPRSPDQEQFLFHIDCCRC
ncbi:hypothetical protein DIPPA_05565 [Diplonema papillatum]|nr:hypothetical protein DIPPA_05565 [Diplonema papillatum]